MSLQFGQLALLPFLISTGISLGVGVYCWRRHAETGAMPYALVAFSQALWTFGYTLELASPSLEGKIFWDNFQFIGGVGWLMAFVAFALEYTGRRLSRPGLIYGLLAIPGMAIVLLAFTDPLHRLVRPQAWLVPGDPFSALLYDFTLPVWIWAIYSYSLILVCIILLAIKYVLSHPLYRTQVGFILAGNLMPLIGTVLTLTSKIQGPYRDVTPFTFAVGNLIVAWGLFRYRLFDVVPLAWDKVIENMSDAVIVVDAQNRVVNLNPTARRVTGLEDAAMIGQPTSQVFADWPEIVEQCQGVKEARAEMEVNTTIGPRYIELRIRPLYDQRNRFKGRVVLVRDITDQKRVEDELRKHRDHLEELVRERAAELIATNEQLHRQILERERLEEELRQSQKLEGIGRLAGGIAHDFNNLLTAINGFAELMQFQLAPDDPLQELVGKMLQSGQRAADLVRQLLAFSRKQIIQPQVLDLNQLVADLDKMLQRIIGEDIELRTNLAPNLGRVKADPTQMEQVIVNLAVNARDAMPIGGRLTLETANAVLDEDYVAGHLGVQPGEYILLAISDTGMGMSREVQAHLFEPFFTTKEVGKGTGLGLATVYGIVKQSGGDIWVYSEEGVGTTFKIYLPRAQEAAQPLPSRPMHTEMPLGWETILVVEDDAEVRDLARRVLHRQGYTVLEAGDGQQALWLAAGYSSPIHLLLSDVVMPGMSGVALAEELACARPDLKVLFMSGYSDEAVARHSTSEAGTPFLQKPFSPMALARQVRAALDG
jgi:PAS domain S-box-containing protein